MAPKKKSRTDDALGIPPGGFPGGRTGHNQKLERYEATHGSHGRKSKLVELLISRWAFGLDMPAWFVQAIADAAVHDGLVHPDVAMLKRIGTDGRNPHNCDKDLRS